MKKILLIIVLIVLAVSGCMEKGSSGKLLSAEELKMLSIKSADNLSTYGLTCSVNQTLQLNMHRSDATGGNVTTLLENIENIVSVNLTDFKAVTDVSTKNIIEIPGKAANTSYSRDIAYQIGNSTYVSEKDGKWIHLKDPRPAETIWGKGNNSEVKALAEMIDQSKIEIVGSEKIGGEDTYKLRIITGRDDYQNLYKTAFSIAAKLTKYPSLVPSINTTELNKTSQMEKLVWISKDAYLPVKYYSSMSFKMTPVIVGGRNPKTGQTKRFNQSVRLGEVSVDLKTVDQYYDFNKQVDINPPGEALKTALINPTQIQIAPKAVEKPHYYYENRQRKLNPPEKALRRMQESGVPRSLLYECGKNRNVCRRSGSRLFISDDVLP